MFVSAEECTVVRGRAYGNDRMSDFLPSKDSTRHASWLYSTMRGPPPANRMNLYVGWLEFGR